MATQFQIDANRRNAQKSTGPTTPEGRAVVRHNALKHGLTSEVLIPMDEQRPAFDLLCDTFVTEYQPVGPTEESLLENLVAAKWRLERARKEETGFFVKHAIQLEDDSQEYRELAANARLAMIVDLDSAGPNTLAKISRYEARLERSFYKALSELRRAQEERKTAEPPAAKQTQSEEHPPEPANLNPPATYCETNRSQVIALVGQVPDLPQFGAAGTSAGRGPAPRPLIDSETPGNLSSAPAIQDPCSAAKPEPI